MTRKAAAPSSDEKRRDLLLDLERWESRQTRAPSFLDVLETRDPRLIGAFVLRVFTAATVEAAARRERVQRVRTAALRMHRSDVQLTEVFLRRPHASLGHRTPLQEVAESAAGEAAVLSLIETQRFGTEHPREPEIIEMLEPRFGSRAAAYHWFRSAPLSGFDGATAEVLVAEGRVQELLDYLAATDGGVHA